MVVLLTGVSGFAGSNIIGELLHHGVGVIGLYRTALPDRLGSLTESARCEFIQGDLRGDIDFPGGIDVIVHTAAEVRMGMSVTDYIENNVLATGNLMEHAVRAGVRKVIYFSSLAVYGEIRTPMVDENTDMINVSPYGLSKYLAELILQEAAEEIPSVSIRLPGILGKGAHGPWISKVYQGACRNEAIEIFNPDALFNNVVHIQDISKFVISLLERAVTGAEALTLGCASPMTVRETVQYIIGICNSSSAVFTRPGTTTSFTISNDKAIHKYGYSPSALKDILKTFARENAPNLPE